MASMAARPLAGRVAAAVVLLEPVVEVAEAGRVDAVAKKPAEAEPRATGRGGGGVAGRGAAAARRPRLNRPDGIMRVISVSTVRAAVPGRETPSGREDTRKFSRGELCYDSASRDAEVGHRRRTAPEPERRRALHARLGLLDRVQCCVESNIDATSRSTNDTLI